jgi:hypothetical protein
MSVLSETNSIAPLRLIRMRFSSNSAGAIQAEGRVNGERGTAWRASSG